MQGIRRTNRVEFASSNQPGRYNVLGEMRWGESPSSDWRSWSPGQDRGEEPSLEMQIGLGSGQRRAPFSCIYAEFVHKCEVYKFSGAFLSRVSGNKSLLEHRFERPNRNSRPSHLEIAMANYESDGFLCLLRYELSGGLAKKEKARGILFIRGSDQAKGNRQSVESIILRLGSHSDLLLQQPLLILNVILALLQEDAHTYSKWRQELLTMEAQLGASHDLTGLQSMGYPNVSYNFNKLNADLAGLVKRVADNKLSVVTILEHAKELQRLVVLCEKIETASDRPNPPELGQLNQDHQDESHETWQADQELQYSERYEEIQSTISRAELYIKHIKMSEEVLESLTAVLFNRIAKSDSSALKTITVITLFFLPATFVSTVFTTGIFNFHAGEDSPRVVSKYGWIYLLVCLLATILTWCAWTGWYVWGGAWLDRLRRPPQREGLSGLVTLKTEKGNVLTKLYHRGFPRCWFQAG
jgi:Mg2+ and Co2+ transporter CorA